MNDTYLKNSLDGTRIFITGGTGFFGQSLMDYCLSQQIALDLVLLSRNPEKMRRLFPSISSSKIRLDFICGDVRNFTFPDGHFDYVIHAATEVASSQATNNPEEMVDVILKGTEHVLSFASHANAKRLLFTSSGAVYGSQPADVLCLEENSPLSPQTAYGKGKLQAEELCRNSGLNVILPRCFAFVGPRMDFQGHFAIGNFIMNCLKGENIIIQGDGTALRSYLFADDLVRWLFTILLNGQSGRPYNVGSDRAVSIRELAETVSSLLKTDNSIQVLGHAAPGAAPNRYIPNIQRAQTELGLSVFTDLEEAIQKTAALKKRMLL